MLGLTLLLLALAFLWPFKNALEAYMYANGRGPWFWLTLVSLASGLSNYYLVNSIYGAPK